MIVTGTGQDDYDLVGTDGDDTIDAKGGNDRIFPGIGSDIVNGGAGIDTVVLRGWLEVETPWRIFDNIVYFGDSRESLIKNVEIYEIYASGRQSFDLDASGFSGSVYLDVTGTNATTFKSGISGSRITWSNGNIVAVGGAGIDEFSINSVFLSNSLFLFSTSDAITYGNVSNLLAEKFHDFNSNSVSASEITLTGFDQISEVIGVVDARTLDTDIDIICAPAGIGGFGDDTLRVSSDADYGFMFGGDGKDTFMFNRGLFDKQHVFVVLDLETGDSIDLGALGYGYATEYIDDATVLTSFYGDTKVILRGGRFVFGAVNSFGVAEVIAADHADIVYNSELPMFLISPDGGDDQALGTANDMVLVSNAGIISSGDGDDRIYVTDRASVIAAGSGDDTIHAAATEKIRGGAGDDWIAGSNLHDNINGGLGNDVIEGRGGNNFLRGGDGNDEIYAESDNDRIFGDDGNDLLNGGAGNDRLFGGTGNDTVYGGNGSDVIMGDEGNDELFGDIDNDYIEGGQGDDWLSGGDGKDIISGGNGNDIFSDGLGYDVMTGGEGADTFTFYDVSNRPSHEFDLIVDFRPDNFDRMNFSDFRYQDEFFRTSTLSYIGSDKFTGAANELRFVNNGDSGYIFIDRDGDRIQDYTIELVGVTELLLSDMVL